MAELQKVYDAVLNGDPKLLAAAGVQAAGRVVIGTVKGGLHDIGKNLETSPVAPQFVEEIGADGYSENASAAVTLARTLTGGGRS